jgi:acetoin utilization protein AcuB
MMLVQEWMTRDVIYIGPDVSMMKASRLMKEKKIRRLPVVDEDNKVLGIVSDRDIKEASPSKATTLDMHELYYLLSELKVKDIMTKSPVCAKPTDSVEGVALIMTRRGFGGMPVVDAERKLMGIITESDIFSVLVSITGVESGGMQLAFDLSEERGQLRPIMERLRDMGHGMVSVLTAHHPETSSRRVYIRVRPIPADQESSLAATIKKEFPSLVYWEPGLRNLS